MTTTKRIEYIDAMRGLAMLLVVAGHVIVHSFHRGGDNLLFNILCLEIELPLFFMISGIFFALPATAGLRDVARSVWRRAFVLLVPAAIFMTLYAYAFGENLIGGINEKFKLGYWFTFSLFGFLLCYTLIIAAAKLLRISGKAEQVFVIATGVMVAFFAVFCWSYHKEYPIIDALGLEQLCYYPFFAVGVVLRQLGILNSNLEFSKLQKWGG